jgi:PAS domain S-box-containing protein
MSKDKLNAVPADTKMKIQSEEARRLSALIENVDVMLWSVREDEHGELYYEQVNNAFAAVSNKTPEEYNGKLLKNLGTEEEYKGILKVLALAKQKTVHTYQVVLNEKSGKKTIIVRIIYVPGEKENYYIGSGADVTLSRESDEKIHLLANALESTSDMVTITDYDDNFIFVNKSFTDTYGYTLEDLKNKKPSVLGSPKNPDDIYEIINKSTKESSWKGELLNVSKDGREFPIQLTTSKILNHTGKIIGLIGVSRDITESRNAGEKLKQALNQKEILLKEVYHRVKNNLQVIYSLLHIQSMSVKDKESREIFKETQNRIKLMSSIHEKLYKSKDVSQIDFSEYLKTLTDQLEQAYPVKDGKIDLIIKSKNVPLGIDKAIPCGLIVNELVSNAYKYAFDGKKAGKVIISLTHDNGKYKLVIEDNGVGLPKDLDFKNTETLGMILVNTLTEQLFGSVEIYNDKGTKFVITFE